MRGTIFSRLRRGTNRLLRDKRGNAMFLTAAAALPVIGLIGSGVDIGRAYMAQLRLQQACDAGVLAGRRAMAGGTYSTAAQQEAQKMFAHNFSDNAYGSSGVAFTTRADGPTSVAGTASATLPTALMQIFDFDEFDLAVNCAAKLEISNTDVMLVLDVTGSMTTVNPGDSVNRMEALKDATMDFYDVLTTAELGDGRLRFGVVPYSSTANVGEILYNKNPNWLSDHMLLPSRSAITRLDWSGTNPPTSVTTGTETHTSWSDILPISGFTSSTCSSLTPPAYTTPTSGTPNPNRTGYLVDRNDVPRYVNDTATQHRYHNYRYVWSGGKCWLQRRTTTFTHSSAPNPSTTQFRSRYRYSDRLFDVSGAKSGGALVVDTGDNGNDRSYYWSGCVMERRTTPFGATSSAPPDALDMDVDSAPTSAEETKWTLLIPEVAFPRSRTIGAKPSFATNSTSGIVGVDGQILTVNSANVTSESSTLGFWQNFSRYWSSGWGVCPAKAMKLTPQTASDRSTFDSYINSLQPVGGTYHDSGMVWGIRLMSPDGMFADENATAPNNRPISRHIVFMTDGDMSANMGNLTFQGYEHLMQRVGGSIDLSDANLTTRHNNRFAQLCDKAKGKNITVWVVSFGVALNTSLTNCATPGKAYQANNAAQLNQNFQAIARQISKLRLSQ